MGIDRKIKLFFVTYGRLLFYIITILFGIIFIIQSLNNYAKNKTQKNKLSEEQMVIIEKQKEDEKHDKEYIVKFIEYCNSKKNEEAYNMLSEECKKEKYNTLNEFNNKYIKNIFSIDIVEYRINKEDNFYTVTLVQDVLKTGKIDSTLQTKIKVDNINNKIYINN